MRAQRKRERTVFSTINVNSSKLILPSLKSASPTNKISLQSANAQVSVRAAQQT